MKTKYNENITKTMAQDKKSGIYMDRVNGKLPMDRVKGYYQDSNAFTRTFGGLGSTVVDSIKRDASAAYDKYAKPTVDAVSGAFKRTFGGTGSVIKRQVKDDINAVKKNLS